jgi:rSAM/selenodomain-associated transferase 2
MLITVIIPTLNEAAHLPYTLAHLGNHAIELIIADGGSQDETCTIAQSHTPHVLHTSPGRSHQMNQAAAIATGDILLFLHADTRLPPNWHDLIYQTLQNPGTIAGAFRLAIDSPRPILRWIERTVAWRSRYLQLPYGDQAIFLRTATFRAIGGYPDLEIMEDFALVQELKKLGHIALVAAAVHTAARRWERLGVWRTTCLNQAIVLGYYIGIPPARLRQWYRGKPSAE